MTLQPGSIHNGHPAIAASSTHWKWHIRRSCGKFGSIQMWYRYAIWMSLSPVLIASQKRFSVELKTSMPKCSGMFHWDPQAEEDIYSVNCY